MFAVAAVYMQLVPLLDRCFAVAFGMLALVFVADHNLVAVVVAAAVVAALSAA